MGPRHIEPSSSNHAYNNHASQERRPFGRRMANAGYSESVPMPVRMQAGMQQSNVPPPLPPPRYPFEGPPEHDRRQDSGHAPAQKGPPAGQKSPSDVPLSFPKSFPKGWGGRMEEGRQPERFEYGHGSETSCPSFLSTMRPPTDSDRRYEAQLPQDEGYYSLSGPGPLSQPSVFALLLLLSIFLCYQGYPTIKAGRPVR